MVLVDLPKVNIGWYYRRWDLNPGCQIHTRHHWPLHTRPTLNYLNILNNSKHRVFLYVLFAFSFSHWWVHLCLSNIWNTIEKFLQNIQRLRYVWKFTYAFFKLLIIFNEDWGQTLGEVLVFYFIYTFNSRWSKWLIFSC